MTASDLLEQARQKGTDEEYRAWMQRQPSCVSGSWSEWLGEIGEGRCEAAHWRTAGNSGTGCKPEYSCVPLTGGEHRLQHRQGQSVLGDRDWWERMVEKYRRAWLLS